MDFNTSPVDLGWVSIAFSMDVQWSLEGFSIDSQCMVNGLWTDFQWNLERIRSVLQLILNGGSMELLECFYCTWVHFSAGLRPATFFIPGNIRDVV